MSLQFPSQKSRWFSGSRTVAGRPTTPAPTGARPSGPPGGKLVFQYLRKRPTVPKCPMTGIRLEGIRAARPTERSGLGLRHKKVFRSYGGEKEPWIFLENAVATLHPRSCFLCRRCSLSQGRPRKDCPVVPHRGAADRLKGAQSPGKGKSGRRKGIEMSSSRDPTA